MQTVSTFASARRVLSSREEFGPPSILDYITLLEKEAEVDFSELKRYFKAFLPFMHGPEHVKIRQLINRRFSYTAMKKWRPRIVSIIEHRLSLVAELNVLDLIVDFVDPLYMDFVEKLFGITLPDRTVFIRQIEIATNAVERMSSISQLNRLQETLLALEILLSEQLENHSNENLFNDIAADIASELGRDDMMSVFLVLLIAPRATTETIAHIVVAYSKIVPQERVQYSQQEWVDKHINDLIRLYASTNLLSKEAKVDLHIDNCPVTTGHQVAVDIPAVNRDPEQYGENMCIRNLVGNSNTRKHLTFGAGPHICIGAELAKEIIRVFVPRFFQKFSTISCDESTLTYYSAQIATRIRNLQITLN